MTPENKPISLLLIEDSAGDANYLRALLAENRKVEFRISRASRVAEGVELIKRGGIDIILSDLHLPDCVGMETVRRVRQAAADIPIIMLTSLDDDAVAVNAVQAGAQDYLVKSDVDVGILVRAIRYAIERKKLENAHRSMARELDELRGLLPVCPACRRERDPGTYREGLEGYIGRLPAGALSASLCPECRREQPAEKEDEGNG